MISYTYEAFHAQFLEQLNSQQRQAVEAVDGNVLLLATPGSGKTTVLVTRLGFMIFCKRIDPRCILTMTYTVAAAKDMRTRFHTIFGNTGLDLQFRTINSFSKEIIEYYTKTKGSTAHSLIKDTDAKALIRQILHSINHDYPDDSEITAARTGITYIKNMMLSDEQLSMVNTNVPNLSEVYKRYQNELRKRKQMDFDDQMVYAHTILRKHPAILQAFQDRFQYYCVDEAQDTSKIQHEIVKLLAARDGNLFMVGDEDQSIYGFRAAYPEAVYQFESDHPSATVLFMESNYRSSPEIIASANRFISRNPHRRKKEIRPTREHGRPVHIVLCWDRESQYSVLPEMVRNCRQETAILFRNNDSAIPLINLLLNNGIPYQYNKADNSFFTNRVVMDMINIIRFAYHPTDSQLFQQIYFKFNAPISKKAASTAIQNSSRSGKPILEELLHITGMKGYLRDSVIDLHEMLPLIQTDSAETALHRIWHGMRYGKYVEDHNYDTGKFFILCMLAKEVPSADAFLSKLEAVQHSLSSHTNQPETRLHLSTIHSSKGLEYECVYLLDIVDGCIPPTTGEDAQKDERDWSQYLEERRLFYVAMTRAKDDLYLFSFDDPSEFTTEIRNGVPTPDENDVFCSLDASQIGKAYCDGEWGKGTVIAQWDEQRMIAFSDTTIRTLSLQDMFSRRQRKPCLPEQTSSPNDQQQHD